MSAVRPKILCVVCREEYVRNYFSTDALEELERVCDCHYIQSERVSRTPLLEQRSGWLGTYRLSSRAERAHLTVLNVLMYRCRRLSSAFRFRIMRVTRAPKWRSRNPSRSLMRRTAGHALLTARAWKLRATIQALASRIGYPVYKKLVMDRLPINEGIVDAIRRVQPDLVVFPSSAYDPDGADVSRACDDAGVTSLFLIDNWDNLSSKSIMWSKPDYLAVWGEQSREHAEEIQGIPRDDVALIGTPRFDRYFQVRNKSLPSHFDFPYVLFVGTTLAFDEADALRILNATMEREHALFGNTKIVYRPHPRRQGKDSIVGMNLSRVVLDPQLADVYVSRAPHLHPMPDLDYYPALIQNAELVVGGLTSMLIEALIFYRRFLALVYDDGVNLTSQHNALRYYPHFSGIEQIHALDFSRDLQTLGQDFIGAWQRRGAIDRVQTDTERNYYLYSDDRPYKQRLADLVMDICAGRDFHGREADMSPGLRGQTSA